MSNESKSGKGLFSIGNIITVILLIAVIIGYAGSKNKWFKFINVKGDNSIEINSMDELTNALEYEIHLPDFVNTAIENGSNPVGDVKRSEFSEFKVDNTLIGTCKFAGYGVDPLDVKSNAYTIDDEGNEQLINTIKIDKVSIENSKVDYIEYVQGIPELEDCTLILWSDNSVNYSMLFGEKVSMDVILENWNIDPSNAKEYIEGSKNNDADQQDTNAEDNSNEDSELNFSRLESSHLSIELPEEFEVLESDGYDVYMLNDKMLIAVMYTDEAINGDAFDGSGEINVTDKIVLRYNKDNPFEEGTSYYSLYNDVLKSIGRVAGSIEFKD